MQMLENYDGLISNGGEPKTKGFMLAIKLGAI